MRSKQAIAFFSILLMAFGLFTSVIIAADPGVEAQGLKAYPAVNPVINYPAFPNEGGPYLQAGTVRPATVAVGGVAIGAPDVFLVFNEDVAGGSVATTDFVAYGFTFSGVSVSGNTVRLTGVTGQAAGDRVRLAELECISGVDGSTSKDITTVTLGSGPLVTEINASGLTDSTTTNDAFTVTFDADVTYGAGETEDTAFGSTPEYNGAALETPGGGDADNSTTLSFDYVAPPGPHPLQIQPGITHLRLAANRIRWEDVDTENNTEQRYVITNQGPHVVAAHYNDVTQVLFVVMSEPVDPSSFDTPASNNFTTGGGFSLVGANVTSAAAGEITNVLLLTDLVAAPDGVDDTIGNGGGSPLLDYQGDAALAVNSDLISTGPGILRVSYDDRRSGSFADDNLYIWLSEETDDLTAIDLDCSDFDPHGFTFTNCVVTDRRNENNLTRITIQGFTATNYPRHGSRINAVDTDGSTIVGDETLENIDTVSRVAVSDESRPFTTVITESAEFTYDRWNDVAGIDSIFVAWTETNGTDTEDYYLFFTKESPSNITSTWMNTYLGSAIPLGDFEPQVTNSPTLNRAGFLIDPGVTMTTDGVILQEGDQIYVLVAAGDLWGNLSQRGDLGNNPVSNHLFGAFLVGPLCPPRDFISDVSLPAEADSADWDHDVIHIVGDSLTAGVTHYIYGDEGAIPCDADSVVVFDGPDPLTDNRLGAGTVNVNGSFDFIELIPTDPQVVFCVWVFSKSGDSDFSTGTQIIFQRNYATIAGSAATPYADFVFDPWNPYRIYNANDYINIRFLGARPYVDCLDPDDNNPLGRSALLHAWADFTQIDNTGGNISGFSTPADSILFASLGADQVDNDGDWQNSDDLNDDGTIDPSEQFDDVGLDGVAGTNDQGEGDGLATYGDPYVDENGNGAFDAGETFLDRVNDTDKGDHIFDPGEPNLDSNDAEEFGWYEVRSTDASVRGSVRQGYRLANPNAAAMLDPYTPIVINIEDNGIDGNVRTLYPAGRNLPFTDVVSDFNRTLFHVNTLNGGDPERRFAAVLDLREPTVSEFSFLANEGGPATEVGTNLIVPGNPVYNLGRYVDFTSANFSDRDVLYNNMRIRIGTSMAAPSGSWQNLTLDPGPQSGAANSDANADGFPGGELYDEDADSTLADSNAFDEDEDGILDTLDDGEGIDFSDREVHAAAQDSTQDSGATNSNGLHAMNDYTDNDNDAFFVYDSYENGGLSATAGTNIGRIYWYNIDESRSNNFDDDNDGSTDEADEAPESGTYGTGSADDNEDGIANGEAVSAPIGNGFSILAIDHDPFALGLYAPPAPGPGVDADFVRVDAAHILGRRPVNATDAKNLPFYANELAYGEVVEAAYENMTYSSRTFPDVGYDLGGAADSTSGFNRTFNWADTHSGENVDWELLSEIYGLTADGATIHQIRANAHDKAGNFDELWSEPISFTLDLDAPLAAIPGCDADGDGDNDGVPPTDFADVSPAAGIQIYDAGKHPQPYTLTATADDDAVEVTFEASFDPDFTTIDFTATDITAPFTAEWPSVDGMYTINNYPAANADTVYFRAIAEDEFGNQTQEDDFCVLTVIVIDGTNPTTVITQIGDDDDLTDGTCVAPDSSINIWADVADNDLDADGNPLDWVAGLDFRTGDAGVDDDGDLALLTDGTDNDGDLLVDEADEGGTDEDDVDGDGIFTLGVDVAGTDGIPGTNDDEWNGSDSGAGNLAETDDYITNDIVKVIFEFNPVDDSPDLGWLPIATVHGDPYSDPPNVIDWTNPVKATWNTLDLETGNYDVRAWACDIEGNCDSTTAFITTVCVRNEPLRAYIQPEVCTGGLQFDLYAVHYIHDYEIDKVRFEYYFDANGDGCANDGNSWVVIDLDDDASGRGDAVLYRPSEDDTDGDLGGDKLDELLYAEQLGGSYYMFWDPENDGYSSRDPVVLDDGDGIFDDGDDDEVIGEDGDIPNGVTLTAFQDDEFYASNDGGTDGLDQSDWIFRENELEGDNNALDLWNVAWDATGLPEGSYLTWSIAIDETNQEDVITYTCYDPSAQNPEELELVRIDTVLPDANIVTITLPDGTVLDVSTGFPTPYVNGSTKWIKICAEGDSDIARMLFEYSLNGGATYNSLDVNNDDDFYADVNDTLGAQIGEFNEDEIFNDLNGNYVYDGPAIDFVRSPGANGVVDTPIGWALIPLSGEDVLDSVDNDFDGVVDEDPLVGTPPDPGSPQDYEAPFCVYLDITDLPLWTDVNVLFRATAFDQVCDIYRADETSDILAVIIGENQPPEADIVRAEGLDGVQLDVSPSIMDDDGCATFGADTDTVRVFVTAEDTSSIDRVELWYRLDPSCYPDSGFAAMQFKSMAADGFTEVDAVYPYDFDIATDLLPSGSYEFYPRAYDETGNYNPAPENPWCFKKFDNAGVDFAFVSDPAPPPAAPDHAAVGDSYVITGELIDPSQEPTTGVFFYYAERVLEENIDPTRVQPLAPYTSEALGETIVSTELGDGVVVTVNGTVATFHSDLSAVVGPTKFDFTVDTANNAIVFGARPDGEDVLLVSYNITGWEQIAEGDEFAPYTVAWSQGEGGIPAPSNPATDAYDLIAVASFDVNGDGGLDEGGEDGEDGCDFLEALLSEGNHLILDDQDRPLVQIWGLDFSDNDPADQLTCPDWNTPGNPLFNSGDDLQNYDYAAKLSGIETDVFITASDDSTGGSGIDSVLLTITSWVLKNNPAEVVRNFPADEYSSSATYIDIPITFYEDDYERWTPESLENIVLQISTDSGSTWTREYQMTDMGDFWQATGRFDVDTTHHYRFLVDLVGDEQETVIDARNTCPCEKNLLGGCTDYSALIVPGTPFWYVHLDNLTDLDNHSVHHAVATVWDSQGNSGTTLNSGMPGDPDTHQGEVVFIHDRDEPVVQSITLLNDENQPIDFDCVSPQQSYTLVAEISDFPYTDLNILAVDLAIFQYSPNGGIDWVTIGEDTDPDDNGWAVAWTPVDGETDGFDNDGDGFFDEEGELVSPIWIRVIARDDGYNSGYSDRQIPGVTLVLSVDNNEPSAQLSQPLPGEVFAYDEAILLVGMATEGELPGECSDDPDFVRFQARLGADDGSLYYVDDPLAGNAGYFDNGIDEVWEDTDGDRTFSIGDTNIHDGADGAETPNGSAANFWFDLDPTPIDNGDLPRLENPNNGDAYQMTWTPRGWDFIGAWTEAEDWELDEYVRLRLVATDVAGNEDTDADGFGPPTTLILLNDDTTPHAYITEIDDRVIDSVETLAIQAKDPVTIEGTIGPNEVQVAKVNVYMVGADGDSVLIGVDFDASDGTFSIVWDADDLAEGTYVLWATTVDQDGNESSFSEAAKVTVRIDRTAPEVQYDVDGPLFDGFVESVPYEDDGVPAHESLVIYPDPDTKDVIFQVTTTDGDVETVEIQWRFATDAIGSWRDFDDLAGQSGMMERQTNLDYVPGGGEPRFVWWLHVEDFADAVEAEGPMQFRAVATDEAGNTNVLQETVQDLTVDATDPTLFDWNDDSPTNHVEVSGTVNFEISTQDLEFTDVDAVQLQYREVGTGEWIVWGTDEAPQGAGIDTDNAMWISRFAWVAPEWVVRDTEFEFRLIVWDSAGNDATILHPNDFTITVDDNAAPDRTKIIAIEGLVYYVDDECDDIPDSADIDELTRKGWEVWAPAYGEFAAVNVADRGEGTDGSDGSDGTDEGPFFNEGLDFLISEGDEPGVSAEDCSGLAVGDVCNTFPRDVTESYLSDANDRNEVRVARTITLVGRTWADDESIDDGIGYVVFQARRLDEAGNTVETYDLGKDEYSPFFPLYYWHLTWNTLEVGLDGNRLYPDGTYELAAYAVDEEGNVEDQTTLDWTAARIVIDNTGLTTQMDVNAATPAVEKTLTVQRNGDFTLFARTLLAGSNTVDNNEDAEVTFWFKRSRDLNMADSWGMVPTAAGVDIEDGNPDPTRPYSFDVRLGHLTEPTDEINNPALSVGESYDFVAAVSDVVCNEVDHLTMFDDLNVSGVGTRHITLDIIDTIAPCLEITQAQRQLADRDEELGDDTPIAMPTRVHARGFSFIEAKLLTGDRDLDHVEFVYRLQGDATWSLIDADLVGSPDNVTWTLGSWDLRTLTHNAWYEVAAVGVDNVGNVCANPDIMLVYVDYDAPPTTLVAPGDRWCPQVDDADGDDLDLIVEVDRGANSIHDDVYQVVFEVKGSDADSTGWTLLAGGDLDAVNYDDVTNRYSAVLDLDLLSNVPRDCDGGDVGEGDGDDSGLYDLRARVIDSSGNASTVYTWKNVVDESNPNRVQISNIWWEGQDTTQDPNDGGQYTDVSVGTRVVVYGTASDDEFCLPNEPDPVTGRNYETGISVMQFQVAIDLPLSAPDGDLNDGEVWRDLGVRYFDPSDHGDASAVSDSVLWNTTGLAEGQYFLRVGAKDECNNPVGANSFTWSQPANVRVTDSIPPIARIACWDTDLQLHGDNPPSRTTLYALAESDPSIIDVQFQYNIRTAGETSPVGEWINIGVSEQYSSQDDVTTETIWYAMIDLTQFDPSVTQLWVRALAEDSDGNRYGDNPTDVVPTLAANIVREIDGMVTLESERSAEQQNGVQVIEYVRTQVVAHSASGREIINIEVKMTAADETPRVLIISEVNTPDEFPTTDEVQNISPYVEDWDGALVRSIDDPTIWRGWFHLEGDGESVSCSNYDICVTGLDGTAGIAQWIDMDHASIREFSVNEAVGTNGTVFTPAYDGLGVSVKIEPGAWDDEGCLLVAPTYPPLADRDQQMYLNLVEDTTYYIELRSDSGKGEISTGFREGYEALVCIQYRDDAVAAALAGTQSSEGDLTVRRWVSSFESDDGNTDDSNVASPLGGGVFDETASWSGGGISHIHVDTLANEVCFRVDNLESGFDDLSFITGNIFALFIPKANGPVTFAGVEPMSPYVNDWWTDVDPEFVAYLKDRSGQTIAPESVELLIDGEYWATWFDFILEDDGSDDPYDPDNNDVYIANWTRGDGVATLEYANGAGTVMELNYFHSSLPRDWLAEGEHTLTIRYMGEDGTAEWVEASRTFFVDRTPPYVEFDGGWVTNPRLINLAGYMNPSNDSLMVKMYDAGSGILFKDLTFGNSYGTDREVKYDLWLVHHEDNQNDIDEIEERVLLHPGTADELEPWIRPRLADYNPATDTLRVPVPVLGGGRIRHNDVLEIVWYSDKHVEQYSDGHGFGCDVDTLWIQEEAPDDDGPYGGGGDGSDGDTELGDIFDDEDDFILVYGRDCTYDSESQEQHIYVAGIQDWTDNIGSRYVEQRFIVDMRPPQCEIVSPLATVTPDGDLFIEVHFSDDGAGIDENSIDVIVYDPSGNPVEVDSEKLEDGVYTATVEGPLDRGEYSVQVRSADLLGNRCNNTKVIRVETAILAMTGAMVYPNPFNPEEADAGIHFTLSKGGDVTAKVYDFGGNYVATLAAVKHFDAGSHMVPWAGESSDHTDLANGSYIVRLTATDGARTEEANLKVVLWRE